MVESGSSTIMCSEAALSWGQTIVTRSRSGTPVLLPGGSGPKTAGFLHGSFSTGSNVDSVLLDSPSTLVSMILHDGKIDTAILKLGSGQGIRKSCQMAVVSLISPLTNRVVRRSENVGHLVSTGTQFPRLRSSSTDQTMHRREFAGTTTQCLGWPLWERHRFRLRLSNTASRHRARGIERGLSVRLVSVPPPTNVLCWVPHQQHGKPLPVFHLPS